MFDSPCSFIMNAVFAITLYFLMQKKHFYGLKEISRLDVYITHVAEMYFPLQKKTATTRDRDVLKYPR